MADLAGQLSVTEDARQAALATISDLRRELADRQLALTAAQDASSEASSRVVELEAALASSNGELATAREQLAAAAAAAGSSDGGNAVAAAAEVAALQALVAARDAEVESLQAQVGSAARGDGGGGVLLLSADSRQRCAPLPSLVRSLLPTRACTNRLTNALRMSLHV